MSEFYVRWYDDYDCLHVSKVHFIDSTRWNICIFKRRDSAWNCKRMH